MDFALCILIVISVAGIAKAAVKCHDCSSWNPYCREKVDEPFESAVAAVECEKTSTCFLKKDESGVINRGCADWWMESQVDIDYTGCQTQHVPWLGEMTWCFCKQDYCNGGSIDMLAQKIYPDIKNFPKQDWGDYEDWGKGDWQESNEVNPKAVSDESQGWGDTGRQWGKGQRKTFDDLNPGYLGAGEKKKSDPKYQLWFWHADSDRPRWEKDEDGDGEGWRAPEWVEEEDGKGWDFPVTGQVHDHTAEETTDYNSNTEYDYSDWTDSVTATATEDKSTTTDTWSWGDGWGHIKPWWLRDNEEETTVKPVRWTPHPTDQPKQQDDGYIGLPSKEAEDRGWSPNSVEQGISDDSIYDVGNKNDVIVDISKQEFFCWDCYSDSPLCGDEVETQKANYLGKTACSTTNKCFVRHDKGVIYRGCADGWTSSIIDTNYVGCRWQQMWGRKVQWCFCTASLCNGDSMAKISEKYEAQLELFKATTEVTTSNSTAGAASVRSTTRAKKSAAAAASRDTTPRHVQKRSTVPGTDNSKSSTDFHVENESELSAAENGTGVSTVQSTKSSSPKSWQTTNTGSDVKTGNGNAAAPNSSNRSRNGTNYKALF